MSYEIIHESGDNTPVEDNDFEEVEYDLGNGQLAVGLKVPTSVKTPVSYLDGLRKYKDIYNDIYKQMEVANKLYKFNSVIGNATDVLVDFAVTKVQPEPTGNAKLDELLEEFFENVNITNTNTMPGVYPLMQEIGLEWFTSGNAFPYVKWDNIRVKKGIYKLPSSINLINPQSIAIPSGPIAFGQEVIYLKYDAELIDKLRQDGRSNPEAALIKQAIPRSVLNSITSSNFGSFTEGIRLNPRYVTHLKRRAKGYQAWGIPYLTRCFSSASLLEKLRELDDSVTSGLLNLVTIFKIGTEEHPATPIRLRKFASLLRNPKATHTLVWAHDVEILQVGPDGKLLQFKDKYRDAKEDILISLGVPPVLMGLSQSGDEWVAILSLVERLTHWRKTISLWLEKICRQIAEFNNFKERPKVKWDRMNLTDEQAVKNLILSFYDRGLISISTSLKEAGYNFDTEKETKKKEKSSGDVDLFATPELPFSSKKNEVEKKRTPDNSVNKKPKKPASQTKTEQTVDLKVQKKKRTPSKKGN